ncbi:BMP family ABC transporter substrate-binding protein [Rhodospirillum sp. A1_3_36]|uniref:BMP family ABC transporter substrate-binding protein n=1 Tax=Rhodospirillum sp. A1_3_36 TaxID=3391666 RepID=UPI0039A6FE4E
MRFNPIIGFLFAVVVLLIWLYQGISGPGAEKAGSEAKGGSGLALEGLALVAGGDRHQEGPVSALVSVLETLETKTERPVAYLDRVTEGEAAQVIGRFARQGWSPILVEGATQRAAALAISEARPDSHLAFVETHAQARVSTSQGQGQGRLSSLGFRDWELGALGGVATALTSATKHVAFLDMASDGAVGQSFEKGARSAVEEIQVDVVRPQDGGSDFLADQQDDALALLEGLLVQGVDRILVRAGDSTLAALVERIQGRGAQLLVWRPWGSSAPDLWRTGGVFGRMVQRPERLVAALLEHTDGAATITQGLAEGAQDLEVLDGVFDAQEMDRLNAYRDGLAREGLKGAKTEDRQPE